MIDLSRGLAQTVPQEMRAPVRVRCVRAFRYGLVAIDCDDRLTMPRGKADEAQSLGLGEEV